MTCPQIALSLLINENAMRIMLDTSLGFYYQYQTQLSIVSLKGISMIGTNEEKSHQEKSFIMLPRSTITW